MNRQGAAVFINKNREAIPRHFVESPTGRRPVPSRQYANARQIPSNHAAIRLALTKSNPGVWRLSCYLRSLDKYAIAFRGEPNMRVKWLTDLTPRVTLRSAVLALTLALMWGCSQATTTSPPTSEPARAPAQAPPTAGLVGGGGPTRTEHDLLGEKQVPAEAYYGVQTARALENFQISGIPINRYPEFIEAWAIVKLAAARANTDVGAMKKETLAAIEKAAEAVRRGDYNNQFTVDWYQGGAGTSTNMNANEVMANVALEMTGHNKGEYKIVEPHDHLNMSQSTNDSYPTAIKVALLLRNDKLTEELENLAVSFRKKGDAYINIVKMGRTELQDAVPMTVGQEFHAWAASLESEIAFLKEAEKYLYAVN